LPKDNENILFLGDEPLSPSEPLGFTPDQMVRCEECLRANPPTRLSCLYCAATLPVNENTTDLIKPLLSPVENWAQGFNNIFLPQAIEPDSETLSQAARLLKVDTNELSRVMGFGTPLPLARTATFDEASLVTRRLEALGLQTRIISDEDLALKESPPVRLRAMTFDKVGLTPRRISDSEEYRISWNKLVLLVTGRLFNQRVEISERKSGRGESEIVDASEFVTDEVVLDLYAEQPRINFRISANGFDFSCLTEKKMIAAENFALLLRTIREKATSADFDESYNSCRQALEIAWPAGSQTGSRGWRRQRPGKISIGAVTENSNEVQFTRYSRLRYCLKVKSSSDDVGTQ